VFTPWQPRSFDFIAKHSNRDLTRANFRRLSAVLPAKKLKLLGPKQRGQSWDYFFHTSTGRQSADKELIRLQSEGWVIQSFSAGGKGEKILLLKRAKD